MTQPVNEQHDHALAVREAAVLLDDLLAGLDVTLTDDILDRIDEIVPPGTDVSGNLDQAYLSPALHSARLRRRLVTERPTG